MTTSAITERDPVCGMSVNPATTKHIHEHAGKNYYFCCSGCAEKFKANPRAYLNKPASSGLVTLGMPVSPKATSPHTAQLQPARKPARASATAPAYVCPMCPEVREPKP